MSEPVKRRHRRKSKRHEKSIIREFSAEIFIGFLFLFGVFLLFEQMEIKSWVFNTVVNTFKSITNAFSNFLSNILGLSERFETSDIVGSILILLAFLLLVGRVRQKALVRFHDLSECPECGSDLIHVHRNLLQRIASKMFFIKIRRYQCKNCEFDGLRMRAKKSR